jgi:hypothetical protein
VAQWFLAAGCGRACASSAPGRLPAAGIVIFSLFKKRREFEYDSTDTSLSLRLHYELQASLHQCFTAFNVFYPAFVLCVIYAMNTLLRRVSDSSVHRDPPSKCDVTCRPCIATDGESNGPMNAEKINHCP